VGAFYAGPSGAITTSYLPLEREHWYLWLENGLSGLVVFGPVVGGTLGVLIGLIVKPSFAALRGTILGLLGATLLGILICSCVWGQEMRLTYKYDQSVRQRLSSSILKKAGYEQWPKKSMLRAGPQWIVIGSLLCGPLGGLIGWSLCSRRRLGTRMIILMGVGTASGIAVGMITGAIYWQPSFPRINNL